MKKLLLMGAALPLCLAFAGQALAQNASEPTARHEGSQAHQVDDIVVTSKQRSERLQDVSLAVTAMDSATLDAAHIVDLRDLSDFTPGLSFHSNSGRRDLSALAIRGLAPNTINVQLQGVSSFFDGIYTGGMVNNIHFDLVDRLEVIKGPQSATYGRATYSGAIDYIIKSPRTETLTVTTSAEYSQNDIAVESNYDASIGVSLPVIQDRLWVGGYYSRNRQGALHISDVNGEAFGREETRSFGLTLYAEPTDRTTVKAFAFFDDVEDSSPANHMQHPQEWLAAGRTVIGTATPGAVWLNGNVLNPIVNTNECVSTRNKYRVACGSDKDRVFVGGVVTHDLNGFELSYRGGFYSEEGGAKYDTTSRGIIGGTDPFFGTPTQGGMVKSTDGISTYDKLEGYSHQIRILSPGEARLRWRAGLYFAHESYQAFSETWMTTTNPTGLSQGEQTVKELAAFAGVAYDLSSRFSLEAEGRVQKETVTLGACVICSASARTMDKLSEDNVDWMPRVTLSYTPTSDLRLYALYSYGTKSGRFNTTAATNFRFTEPETLNNYEIGAKSSWLNRRLTLNAAAFVQEVQDQQFTARDPINVSITYTQNIGRSEIWGFEAEGAWRINSDLRAHATLSYADHEYASFAVPAVPGAAISELLNGDSLLGKTSVNVPPWNASAGLSYSRPLFGDAMLDLRADVLYRGEAFADQANLATIPALTRLNLRAGLGLGDVKLAFFVRNAFNEKGPLGAASTPTSCVYRTGLPTINPIANQRCLSVAVPRGREIGASVSYRF